MAALTGCYTSWSTRIPHDTVERVERVPAGTHLTLLATEEEPGALAVVAEEQPMCRDEESGTRAWTIRTVSTRGRSGSGGGMGLGGCGGGGGAFGLVCLGILVGVLVVLIPVAIIAASLPDRTEREEPSEEPPQPYRELRGERAGCDEWAGIAPGLPLRLVTPLNQSVCLEWRTATAADGTLALLPALDRGRAAVVPCDRPVDPGYLRIEPVDEAAPPPGAPEASLRTHDALLVPLWQPVADSIGLAVPPVARPAPSSPGEGCPVGPGACAAPSLAR
jgi:hypothetical protein